VVVPLAFLDPAGARRVARAYTLFNTLDRHPSQEMTSNRGRR
jgi:hypothetical protein